MVENKYIIDNGLLTGVRYLPSPHFDLRPINTDIDLLVIHYISLPPEEFGGEFINQFFLGKLNLHQHPYFRAIAPIRVSAHCLINRDGKVTQYVNFNDRAWHAGLSSYRGKDKCNDYAIGIELEGSNNQPFTEQQYVALCEVTQSIMEAYPSIKIPRIVGHCDIAPGRKVDPGKYFKWQHYFDLLKK